ncbi:MAG: penicillin-binding protein 2 [Candidatus Hydrogenedentota bacterium]|nr:MAG: penicillin-binding protein 2 [Candidatus Hydrogenedentota bacterium]
MKVDPQKEQYDGFSGRLFFIAILIALAMVVLVTRLWSLQIVRWDEFREKSTSNRLRIQRLESPRGMIYGRNGLEMNVVLADNRAARDLLFVLADCDREPEEISSRLNKLIGIDEEELLKKIRKAEKDKQPHRQIIIRKDIPRSVAGRVEEYAYALPGVFTVVRPVRRYVYGKTGGQLLGYLSEVNRKELNQDQSEYRMGDLKGRSGLERLYEDTLRGTDGRMLVTKFATGVPQLRTDPYGNPYVENLVDSYGHNLQVEEEIEPSIAGESIHISLDIGLQAKAEELLKGEEGAIVVLNADTGETLVLASSPGYDPGVFVSRRGSRERMEILKGKPNRMINRAFQEVYPPGSAFKVLMAAAALEEGIIDENTTFTCWGRFHLPGVRRPWHCWRRVGHGKVNVVDALAFSCDVYFYEVGQELSVDRIKEWSTKMGLGVKTGLDMPGEEPGLIPSREWKEKRLKPKHPNEPWEYRWYPGETVNLSIGQGSANSTPLQCAVLMAFIVNGGYLVQPYLNEANARKPGEQLLSNKTVDLIREGLLKCVAKGPPAPTGTGHRAYIEGMTILGKTGSAQNVSLIHHEKYENEEDIPKELRDHAWFISGVLDREPRIAICILVEHGHHGSSAAAPLAKELIEYFYASLEVDKDRLVLSQENTGSKRP